MKRNLLIILFSLFYFSVVGQSQITHVSTVEGIKEYKLDNGLKVLFIQDATQNNVVVNIVYDVGSRHEGYGEKGMAHLLEHMLFKSTKKLGDIKTMLSDKGGQANGTTWYDRTNYYEVFPSSDESLRWSIEMEADRMVNATLLQSDLEKEFSVVRNEFEIGENDPERVLMERIFSTAYLWHNYGNSTIGSKEDIERVNTERLRVFYEKYYQPDNATLIIGGKFDEDDALKYIVEYFGAIPKPTRVLDKTYTVEPAQDGERFVELNRAGDTKVVAAAYHVPAYADEDYAAVEALLEILTSDPSGYLYKALVDTREVVSQYGFQFTPRDPGLAYFSNKITNEKDIEAAKNVILAELDKIPTIDYNERDLERAQSKILKYIENTRNNTLGFTINLTEIIGAGNHKLGFIHRDRVEALTVEDIKRAAKKYFISSNRTVGVFSPDNEANRVQPNEVSDEAIAALTQNYQGKESDEELVEFEASIPNIQKHLSTQILSNGLKLGHLKKDVKGKKVSVNLTIPYGSSEILKGKKETLSVLGSLLKAGTTTRSKEDIQDETDRLKSSIGISFTSQNLSVGISSYEEQLPQVMDLLKDILTNSTFPQDEFDKTIERFISNVETNRNDPQSIAFEQINRKINAYPKGHIFYTSTPDESIEALKSITLEDIKAIYSSLGANNGFATVIGGLSTDEVVQIMEKTVGDWTTDVPYKRVFTSHFPSRYSTENINTPDKENGVMVAMLNFEADQKSPDYPALVMADAIIGSGGFLTARIPTRLRENEGISYGAGSFLNVPTVNNVASWGMYAFYNPQFRDQVEEAVKAEVESALKDGFTQEELDSHKGSWMTGRATQLGLDNAVAGLINGMLFNNVPLENFTKLNEQVQNVTLEEVNKALRKYISLDKIVFLYAGDFDK